MDENNKQISVGTRLGAMLLDHFFMTIIVMLFAIPGMAIMFATALNVNGKQSGFMDGASGYTMLIGFALYFCKDAIGGRSIAKRILKLQVVDNVTGQPAGPLKCLVRDLFCIIWPVEAIIALVNPARRLGDRVAGTRLVIFDAAAEKTKRKSLEALVSIVIAYGILLIAMLPFKTAMSMIGGQSADYVESSLNQQEGLALQKVLGDSLGTYFTPEVAVYDTVRHENLKYISIVLQLKANYLEEESNYKQLEKVTTSLVYSKYPKETFTGSISYVFRAPGQIKMRTSDFGTEGKAKE